MMVEFNKSVDIAFSYHLLWLCNVRPLVLDNRGTKFRNLGAEKDNHLPPGGKKKKVHYQVYFNLISDSDTPAMSLPVGIPENGGCFQ